MTLNAIPPKRQTTRQSQEPFATALNDEQKSDRQIKLGAVAGYCSILITAVAGLFYMPWLLRVLGKDAYGLYSLATSLVAIFLFDFGMSQATTRFLSRFNALKDRDGANRFLGLVYKLYLTLDVGVALVFFVLYFFLDDVYVKLTPEQLVDFKKVYVAIAVYSVVSFPFITLNGILTSCEKFVWLNGITAFNRVFIVAATIAALYFGFGLFALVAVQIGSGALVIALKLFVIRRYTIIRVDFSYFDKETLKAFFGYSGWTTLSALAQRFIFYITPSILGAFANSAEIGLFGVAILFEGYFVGVATAINNLFLPKASRIILSGEKERKLLPLATNVGRFQLFVLGAFFFGFVLFGSDFIVDVWLSEEYRPVYYCVLLYIFPSFIALPQRIGDAALAVENKVRLQAFVYLAGSVVNVALSLVLTRSFGLYGASVAIFSAYLLRAFAMSVVYSRALSMNMRLFFQETFLKLTPFFVLAFFGGLAISRGVPGDGLAAFLGKSATFVVYYLCLAYFVGLNSVEKQTIAAFFGNFARKTRRFAASHLPTIRRK